MFRTTAPLLILFAFPFLPSTAQQSGKAAKDLVIASESFDYLGGAPLKGASRGAGWDGPWIISALHKNDNKIGAGSMIFKSLSSLGNRLIQVGDNVRSYRKINTTRPELAPLLDGGKFGKDGTTIWIGFLAALSAGENTNLGSGGVHLYNGLGDLTADPDGDKKSHQVLFMGDRNSATKWCLERTTGGAPGGSNHDSEIEVDTTVRFLVYRIDFNKGLEMIHMFIDPAPGAEPKDEAAAMAVGVSDFRFDTVEVGSATNPGKGPQERLEIDELRIATSFRGVAPVKK